MKQGSPILVVEDNENDALLIRRTLEESGIPNPPYVLKTGEQAIAYLVGMGRFSDRKRYPLPAVVLVDLKLPGMDGFAVLERIRANPLCRDLRVIVLTSSTHIRDVNRAYRLGANSFLVKPLEFENIRAFFSTVGAQLWKREESSSPLPKPSRTPNAKPHQSSRRFKESPDGHWTLSTGW